MENIVKPRTAWESHDWKVKTLDSVLSGGGSRLGFTCRSCERTFTYLTASGNAWAVNPQWVALADEISGRWLRETCPIRPGVKDDEDRKALKNR